MLHSQASSGNTTNIRAQPSPSPAGDDRVIHAEEIQERQIISKVIEHHDPLTPVPGHIPTCVNYKHRLYALIIGINNYLSIPKLAGAVNDAKAIEEFLKSRMDVPQDRICMLLEHDASREGIINAFKELSEEKEIERDDPILIYYAGHGVQLPPPKGWEAGGAGRQIQGICPYDCKLDDVHAIPDRTLGDLLDLICEKKGNNITVIFDCCHSSSGTRVDEHSTYVRGIVLNDELPLDLDRLELPMSVGRGFEMMTKFGRRGLGSHVLLAACQENETAKEDSGKGRFTTALLELFSHWVGRMETLTYTDILKHIKRIDGQNPQVEGIHRDRIIFNAKAKCHPFYFICFDTVKKALILDAGSAHGVATGSRFTIYEDYDSYLKLCPWGSLLVSSVMEYKSLFQPSERTPNINLNKPGIAILSAGGMDQTLAIIASYDQEKLPSNFLEAIQRMEKQHMILLVDKNAEVQMQLQDDGHLVFNILDPTITACGLDQVYHTAKPTDTADKIAGILSAGSSFFWHLRRGHEHPIVNHLKVEFMELEVSKHESNPTKYPIYAATEENLLQDGVIDLLVCSDPKPYGIRITNNSEWDLFPAAFYFDHSDWSIDEYYHPGTAGQFEAEVPLRKRGGTVTIGYGAGGHVPISFRLNGEHQDLDVGHLKIFFSTKSVDLRFIQQESPFTGIRKLGEYKLRERDTWFTLLYPIIQRRA